MAKERFVSENLVEIREHLRQNYAAHQKAALAASRPADPSAENTAGEIHLDLTKSIPLPQSGSRSAEREFADFSGKLGHDREMIAAAIVQAEDQLKKLEEFHSAITRISEEISKQTPQDSLEFFREFDRLRIAFFQASGKLDTPQNTANKNAAAPAPAPAPAIPRWILLLTPAAILLAGILVAAAMILVFS